MTTALALKPKLQDFVDEYDEKKAKLKEALSAFERAGSELNNACTVMGTYGRERIDTGSVYIHTLESNLTKSAWLHVYSYLQIDKIASAKDKQDFEYAMNQDPPPFTFDNIVATFGDYIEDPRKSILRGLAEVFCTLDQSYKSHDKVKIGVKGLPKRVIINNLTSFWGHGEDKLRDILDALAQYQGLPLTCRSEIKDLIEDGQALNKTHEVKRYSLHEKDKVELIPSRGVWLKTYKNGNGHLYFNDMTLTDINKALAEYYGEVLADAYEEKPTERAQSTAVSKDLQFYHTPEKAVSFLLRDIYIRDEDVILEPSAGEGHIIDGIMKENNKATVHGIEVDYDRTQKCKEKGYKVACHNFLDVNAKPVYDKVIMNPPFYGKHYAKHIEHALKFLKDDGVLFAILPITAKTDHGLLDKYKPSWYDLPVGSFKESGTNINTTVVKIFKR